MSAARSLERIADVLEQRVPETEPIRVFTPPRFAPAVLSVLLRACPDPDLIRPVPAKWYDVVDRTAVVTCPCEHVVICPPGWTGCDGCDRTYIWSGRRLMAVRGAEDRSCPCDTVKREHGQWVCSDCGEAA